MKIFFLLFLSLTLQAREVTCPKQSYKVDYESGGLRKIICYKIAGGGNIKHGPEVHLDELGNVVFEKYYEDDQEVQKKSLVKSVARPKLDNKHKAALELIRSLFRVSNIKKGNKDKVATFSNNRCPGNSMDWVKLLTQNKPFKHVFNFEYECDLKGVWAPVMNKFFNVSMGLKDLKDFTHVSFKLKFVFDKMKGEFKFFLKDGVLKGKSDTFNFTSDFNGKLNFMKSMQQRALIFTEENATATFTKHNGKSINIVEEYTLMGL